MSSVDLSDPHITMAYDAILHNDPLRWFLLAYGNRPNVLSLCASGTGDVDELRSHLPSGNVCYGLFREQTQDKFLHVSLSYIPDSVKGVWRARALVHGKAVSSKFKAHQVLNASDPEQVTVQALRSILRLPPRVPPGPSTTATLLGASVPPRAFSIPRKPTPDMRSASLSLPPNRQRSPSPTDDAHPRSASSPLISSSPPDSGVTSASTTDSPPAARTDGSSLPNVAALATVNTSSPSSLANIVTASSPETEVKLNPLRSPIVHSPFSIVSDVTIGAQGPQTPHSPQHASWLAKQDAPLPPPPLAEPQEEYQGIERRSVEADERSVSSHMGSIPDSQSVASLHSSNGVPSPAPPPQNPVLSHSPVNGLSQSPTEAKPVHAIDGMPPSSLTSPLAVAQDDGVRSRENSVVMENSTSALTAKKTRSRFQERAVSAAEEEEERKLVVLEEERRRRAAERAKREKEEREEEEAREREFEGRKEREKKRRLESAKRAEERRVEQKRQQEEEEARRKEEKERKEVEARQRRNHIQQRFEKQAGMDLLSGFITLESSSNWKRRYYRLSTEDWTFFKSDEEVTAPMHVIELSRVRALREWHEGYDELEAIPHSFAVELKDDTPWLFFADSAEDKEILLGLLNQAAGL